MIVITKKLLNFVVIIASVALLGSCSTTKTGKAAVAEENKLLVEKHATKQDKREDTEVLNEKLFASANLAQDPAERVLGPGDLIQVTIFEAKELNTEARVSARGFVTLPLLGQVLVKGASAREAEVGIEELYRKNYIKDPHVSIFIKEHYSQRVTLVGQVKDPGTVDYHSKQRLLDVLALAGGLTEKAGGVVEVRREGKRKAFLIDIDKLVKEGQDNLNIEINGGDVIFVPEAGVFFADGAVRKPGSYQISQKMVLQEAIMMAGGFSGSANKNKITLIRRSDDNKQTILEIDLKNNPDGNNIPIKNRDVLIAKFDAMSRLLHGTGIRLGIPGLIGVDFKDPGNQ